MKSLLFNKNSISRILPPEKGSLKKYKPEEVKIAVLLCGCNTVKEGNVKARPDCISIGGVSENTAGILPATASFRPDNILSDCLYLYNCKAAACSIYIKTCQMPASFNGKTSNNQRGDEYDFLNGVFEWVFYNLPAKSDNSFIRNMYEFYKTRGGLSKKQLEALLKTVYGIGTKPPFSPATLEAIIKKKASKSKLPLPQATPMYKEDTDTREKLNSILSIFPAHKGALLYLNKLNLHQPLSGPDKTTINKFFELVRAVKNKKADR